MLARRVPAALAAAALALAIPWAPAQAREALPEVPVEGQIIGGSDASITDAPWQVALLLPGDAPTWDRQFCGGSIISAEWILTAAHCVVPDPRNNVTTQPEQIVVLSGTAELAEENPSPGLQSAVSAIIVHPDYVDSTYENDVALLRLETPLALGPTRQAIALPGFTSWPANGSPALITGWGNTSTTTSDYPQQMQKATVQVIGSPSAQVCGDYESSQYVASVMLCAGIPVEGGIDSCQGDSGGPLAVSVDGTYYLAGVTSWGDGCAKPGYPGIYARVSAFTSWISATQAASLGSITVDVTSTVPNAVSVCAYAYNPDQPEAEAIAGGCGSTNAGSATIPNLLPGDYQVQVMTDGPLVVASWWSPSGKQDSRGAAGAVTVSPGADSPVSTTLDVGGQINIKVSPVPRSKSSYVCFIAYPVGSEEWIDYSCPRQSAEATSITRLPVGAYHIEVRDLEEFYPHQWYRGQSSRSKSIPVVVAAYGGPEISIDVSKLMTAPGTVRDLKKSAFTRTGSTYEVTVRWTAPASNGGSPVTGYRVVLKKGSKVVDTLALTQRSVTLTSMSKNTGYTVQVRAINAVGTGPVSSLSFTTPRR